MQCQIHENYQHLIIPSKNHENHEIHNIQLQTHENHENLIMPHQNHENHEIHRNPR